MWFSYFSIFSIPQQYNGSWGYVLLRLINLKEKHQIRQRWPNGDEPMALLGLSECSSKRPQGWPKYVIMRGSLNIFVYVCAYIYIYAFKLWIDLYIYIHTLIVCGRGRYWYWWGSFQSSVSPGENMGDTQTKNVMSSTSIPSSEGRCLLFFFFFSSGSPLSPSGGWRVCRLFRLHLGLAGEAQSTRAATSCQALWQTNEEMKLAWSTVVGKALPAMSLAKPSGSLSISSGWG